MSVIGSIGNGSQGDIALDDFKLYPYNCSLGKDLHLGLVRRSHVSWNVPYTK